MKKFIVLLLAVFVAMGVAIGQNADKKWALGLGPGVNMNLESSESNILGNIYLSRYLNPSFDLMLDNRAAFYEDGTDLVNPLLNLRYKLNNGYIFKEKSAIQPYLFGGVGYLFDNQAEGVNFDGGVGVKVPVSPSTSLFVAGSYVKGIEGNRMVNGVSTAITDDLFQITIIL